MLPISNDVKLDFSDVLLVPRPSCIDSRNHVSVIESYYIRGRGVTCVPIMAANMDGVGTIEMMRALSEFNVLTALNKFYSYKELHEQLKPTDKNICISIGLDVDLIEFANFLKEHPFISMVCIDAANGYSTKFQQLVKQVRTTFEQLIIIAGNVVTPIGVRNLHTAGADIIKVGLGSGSVCTTRLQTGVGYPQLSAIHECEEEAKSIAYDANLEDFNCFIMSDGGCTCPGDLVKAYGAGAKFVMLGGMLAGHKEGGAQLEPGCVNVPFYGMASREAMEKHGKFAPHRSSEGKKTMVGYKGEVKGTITDIINGIKSGCSYLGVPTLGDLYYRVDFIRVNRQVNDIFTRGFYE